MEKDYDGERVSFCIHPSAEASRILAMFVCIHDEACGTVYILCIPTYVPCCSGNPS